MLGIPILFDCFRGSLFTMWPGDCGIFLLVVLSGSSEHGNPSKLLGLGCLFGGIMGIQDRTRNPANPHVLDILWTSTWKSRRKSLCKYWQGEEQGSECTLSKPGLLELLCINALQNKTQELPAMSCANKPNSLDLPRWSFRSLSNDLFQHVVVANDPAIILQQEREREREREAETCTSSHIA